MALQRLFTAGAAQQPDRQEIAGQLRQDLALPFLVEQRGRDLRQRLENKVDGLRAHALPYRLAVDDTADIGQGQINAAVILILQHRQAMLVQAVELQQRTTVGYGGPRGGQ